MVEKNSPDDYIFSEIVPPLWMLYPFIVNSRVIELFFRNISNRIPKRSQARNSKQIHHLLDHYNSV